MEQEPENVELANLLQEFDWLGYECNVWCVLSNLESTCAEIIGDIQEMRAGRMTVERGALRIRHAKCEIVRTVQDLRVAMKLPFPQEVED